MIAELKEPKVFDNENGRIEYHANETNVWIVSIEAKQDTEFAYIKLYKQAEQFFLSSYPEHKFQIYIDASNDKLLKHFLKHYLIEYVCFTKRSD